ncbi:MAG: hypothetical protein ACREXT_03905, partial [Gammaproteobacteria bacterium]
EYLFRRAKRGTAAPISSFMLYSIARRYDDIPGYKADTGSSVRACLKGWHKHGAAVESLWPELEMPPAQTDPKKALQDWWLDAVRCPLGAYYRIDPVAMRDMHVAINEVGALRQPVRFHPVGHSAGSIVHAWVIDELAKLGETFESVSFMAPSRRAKRASPPHTADSTTTRRPRIRC